MFQVHSNCHYTIYFINVMSTWGPFQCMFLYFLRIVQYFLMKFCIDVCSTNLMVTALEFFIHIIYVSAGGRFGVFLDQLFQCMFLYFFRALQYFLIKFCTNIFDITLTIAALKKVFHTIPISLLGVISQYFGDHYENFLMTFYMGVLGSYYFKWCKIFEAWT